MTNIRIKFCFLFLFLLSITVAHAQEKLERELDSYTQEIKNRVIEKVKSGYQNNKYIKSMQKGNFVCIPYCELNGSRMFEGCNDFDFITIRKDTGYFGLRIDYTNDSIFIIPDYIPWSGFVSAIYDDDFIFNDPFFLMSQYAIKFSKYCFALKIRDNIEDRRGFLTVCYIKKNKLHALSFNGWDTNGKIIIGECEGIENYIRQQYGGLAYYKSLIGADSAIHARYFTDVNEPRQILRGSYFYYEKCFAADTLIALHAMLVEMDSMVSLTKQQYEFLKKEIISNLQNSPVASGNYSVEFLGKDVSGALNKVLTNEQATIYKKKYISRRVYEADIFDTFCQAYEYWDDQGGVVQGGSGVVSYNLFNSLQNRALTYIFSH